MLIYRVENCRVPFTQTRVVQAVEQSAIEFGLQKGLEQHLAARSHWHLHTLDESSTLEVTFDVPRKELLVIVHDNRMGAGGWAKKQAPRFARTLANQFEGKVKLAA
ncbi:MAG TPA: hypothetical protein VFD70_22585 [Anaerolineae bacterium]|nr:hypothetical protein [Anaerolineae bacterium]